MSDTGEMFCESRPGNRGPEAAHTPADILSITYSIFLSLGVAEVYILASPHRALTNPLFLREVTFRRLPGRILEVFIIHFPRFLQMFSYRVVLLRRLVQLVGRRCAK